MRYSFLHAADLHLDSPLRGLDRYEEAPVEAIRSASRRAFGKLIARAIELQVAFVILSGDVFDGDWKDFNSGLWFAARLRELTSAGIRVYLLAGNHDAAGKMTMQLSWPDNVFVFDTAKPQSFVDSKTGAVLHGQGFATGSVTDDLTRNYPRAVRGAFNIGVLHTALDGRPGHGDYAPCTVDGLRSLGYDYWALGHVHAREIVSKDPWIVFPGNLQSRHVNETGEKGATLVTVDDGRVVEVSHEEFDVVRFARVEVDVSGTQTMEECARRASIDLDAARTRASGRLLAIRLVLRGRTAANVSLRCSSSSLVATLRDRANARGDVWIERVEISTTDESAVRGMDVITSLELDDESLHREAIANARAAVTALLEKLPAGIDLAAAGLDLQDDATLLRWMSDARSDIVNRISDHEPDSGRRER